MCGFAKRGGIISFVSSWLCAWNGFLATSILYVSCERQGGVRHAHIREAACYKRGGGGLAYDVNKQTIKKTQRHDRRERWILMAVDVKINVSSGFWEKCVFGQISVFCSEISDQVARTDYIGD